MLGAMRKLTDLGVPGLAEPMIVVGLPAASYGHRKDQLKKIVADLFPGCETMAQQQPAGALWAHILHDTGAPRREYNLPEQRWGVVEVGHFTTDFLLMSLGRFIQAPSGSPPGVSTAVDYLVQSLHQAGIMASPEIAMNAMKHNFIIIKGERRDVSEAVAAASNLIAQSIIDESRKRFGEEVDFMDGVVVAGGGASLIIDRLQELGWTHAKIADTPTSKPRFSVAEGFARYGNGMLLIEQQQARKRA